MMFHNFYVETCSVCRKVLNFFLSFMSFSIGKALCEVPIIIPYPVESQFFLEDSYFGVS